MKILIGIRRTSQMAGSTEYSPNIKGQSTDIITSGTEEEVKSFVDKYRELEKGLPKLCKESDHFSEYGWEGYSEEECEKISMEYHDKINKARTLKKYQTLIIIDGDIL